MLKLIFSALSCPRTFGKAPTLASTGPFLRSATSRTMRVLILSGDSILTQKRLNGAISRLVKASGWDEATIRRKVHEILFPNPEIPSKPVTIVFGQRLLLDSLKLFEDSIYVNDLRSLLCTAAVAAMRDPNLRIPGGYHQRTAVLQSFRGNCSRPTRSRSTLGSISGTSSAIRPAP
jgi:hypothetical protein